MKSTYAVVRSRRRTLSIHVKPDGSVEIRAPLRLSAAQIERFVASKQAWIDRKTAELAAPKPPIAALYGDFEGAVMDFVALWEGRLGVKVAHVSLRAMRTRWGSCTAKTSRIRLNSALIFCPPECLEYVVVHELCHISHPNHSAKFWAVVASALPDYKVRERTLRALRHVLNNL